MSVPKFFALYRSIFRESGKMAFAARMKLGLVWIDSKVPYSNNKQWG
jgi:hypothetical protein